VVSRCGGSRWLAGVILGIFLAGCTSDIPSSGQSPEGREGNSDAVSYGLFGGEVCDQVPWDGIGADLGLTVDASLGGADDSLSTASPGDITTAYRWFVECRISSVYAVPETPLHRANGHVSAVRYGDSSIAYDRYLSMVEPEQRREDGRVVVPIEGWWDSGVYVELQKLKYTHRGLQQHLDLAYYLHHGDLYLRVEFGAAMPAGVKDEGVPLVHEFALRVADEVQALLPVEGAD
jgi:hypothetical protein